MKKILAIVMCCCLVVLPFCFAACTDDGKTTIRLNEVTHSVFYAPLYIAINNGYFDDADIKIELTNGGGANNVMTALVSGGADIGLMGPEATIYCINEGKNDAPAIFGQLTKRDGSFLMSKTDDRDTFKWSDITGKKIIIGREGGVPSMTLEYILNQHGLIDGVNCTMNKSIQFNDMGPTFAGSSEYSYTTLFEPTASEFQAEGKGYIVTSVGQESGEIPYTAFSALTSYLTKNRETAKKFLAAVYRGYIFMDENDSETVAKALEPSFVGTSLQSLKYAVESYLAIDAWASTPVMTEASYNYLQKIIVHAGVLKESEKVDFSKAVDNSIAKEIVGLVA